MYQMLPPEYGALVLQTDDRQTNGWAIAYSKREHEFTFAKNGINGSFTFHKFKLHMSAAKFCAQRSFPPLS